MKLKPGTKVIAIVQFGERESYVWEGTIVKFHRADSSYIFDRDKEETSELYLDPKGWYVDPDECFPIPKNATIDQIECIKNLARSR